MMPSINVEQTTSDMLAAAKLVFGDKWPEVKKFAESESKKFAENMLEIEKWKKDGDISESEAISLSKLHQRSMKMVFTALEGISLAIAEKAINAALDVVRSAVNTAIGWPVI